MDVRKLHHGTAGWLALIGLAASVTVADAQVGRRREKNPDVGSSAPASRQRPATTQAPTLPQPVSKAATSPGQVIWNRCGALVEEYVRLNNMSGANDSVAQYRAKAFSITREDLAQGVYGFRTKEDFEKDAQMADYWYESNGSKNDTDPKGKAEAYSYKYRACLDRAYAAILDGTGSTPSPRAVSEVPSKDRPDHGNRPKFIPIATFGTKCVTASSIAKPAAGHPGHWDVRWVLTNNCPREQIVSVETADDHETGGFRLPQDIGNVGMWRVWRFDRPTPPLPFKPQRTPRENPDYRIGPNEKRENGTFNQYPESYKVWVFSCDAFDASGHMQTMFRSTYHLRDNPAVACVPMR